MTREEARTKIKDLSEQINHHNDLYYNQDKSEIPDVEFDQLINQLIEVEANFPDLKITGPSIFAPETICRSSCWAVSL